jgi:hypothetical protein
MTIKVHKFRHTYDLLPISRNKGIKYPLWLIAQDPFADIETDNEGYIVHLGNPRFTARWYTGDKPLNPANTLHGITYNHTDLDISLCEIVFLEENPDMSGFSEWLQEACCAIAHYLGDIAGIEPNSQ